MNEFYVGQKVVCVDDEAHPELDRFPALDMPVNAWIKRGHIYTVRKLMCRKHKYVWLSGIRRDGTFASDGVEYADSGFYSFRFRPLEEKKHDISIFRQIAQGVTDGKPIVDDPTFDPALPTEALCAFMFKHGRPIL